MDNKADFDGEKWTKSTKKMAETEKLWCIFPILRICVKKTTQTGREKYIIRANIVAVYRNLCL